MKLKLYSTSFLKGSGVFSDCVTNWCPQADLTYPQYTQCESISNDGSTCYNPQVKYGTSPVGFPYAHNDNDYNKICEQLGGSYEGITVGVRTGYRLFWCNSGDETNWHWCDGVDSNWYNGSLDGWQTRENYLTSITCGNDGATTTKITGIVDNNQPIKGNNMV